MAESTRHLKEVTGLLTNDGDTLLTPAKRQILGGR